MLEYNILVKLNGRFTFLIMAGRYLVFICNRCTVFTNKVSRELIESRTINFIIDKNYKRNNNIHDIG